MYFSSKYINTKTDDVLSRKKNYSSITCIIININITINNYTKDLSSNLNVFASN